MITTFILLIKFVETPSRICESCSFYDQDTIKLLMQIQLIFNAYICSSKV